MPRGGAAHEIFHHIVGIIGVADAIGAAQQHLGQEVWRPLAHERETLPGIFGEKPHRDVEGRAAPAFEREQLRQPLGVGSGHRGDVFRAHARREQRLMRVPHGGVGDEKAALGPHPFGETCSRRAFRTIGASHPGLGRARNCGTTGSRAVAGGRARSAGFGMAVDRDVGDPGQEFCRPVLALLEIEQRRSLVDEARRVIAGDEARMVDDIVQEGEIGGDTANAIFEQRAIHSADRFFRRRRPGGDFFEQRIVETGDDGAGIGGAAVDADAKAHRAAIGGDAAIIGNEIVFRIFRRDAALQGMAGELDDFLRRYAGLFRNANALAFGDPDLRLHDVEAGDHLGHGMLDLDARIDLDEIERAGIGIHQELDRAGAGIMGRAPELQRRLAKALARVASSR